MPSEKTITPESIDPEIAGYLKNLSQRVYNLTQIISVHRHRPVKVDKKLMDFFDTEKENLSNLLLNQPEGQDFVFNLSVLPDNLISNELNTKKSKSRIENAEDELGDFLAKIQKKRSGPRSTGIEEGILKDYLGQLEAKKEMTTEEKARRIQKAPEVRLVDNRTVLRKSKKRILEVRKIPEGLIWEEITVRFLNGNEVLITTREETYQTNYEAMGFQDEKKKEPNVQWKLLEALALRGGCLNWENNARMTTKEILKIKKRKQLLSDTLKTYFYGVADEPFLDYRAEGEYKIRIQLIPEQDSELEDDTFNPNEPRQRANHEDDSSSYARELSPEIDESPQNNQGDDEETESSGHGSYGRWIDID